MTTLNPALNYSFVQGDALRVASADRGAEQLVASQLTAATLPQSKFAVGTTITARYQYKVAEDGSLLPLQTQVTTEPALEDALSGSGRRGQRQFVRDEAGERRPSFGNLSRPKPQLTPSDEVSLLASIAGGRDTLELPQVDSAEGGPGAAGLIDGQGNSGVEVAVDADPNSHKNFLSQLARHQFAVANLYARNNDVVYNVTPIALLAA